MKIIKLDIPQDTGGDATVCFTVESRPSTAQRKTGFASRLEPLACGDFARLKAKSIVEGDAEKADPAQAEPEAEPAGTVKVPE